MRAIIPEDGRIISLVNAGEKSNHPEVVHLAPALIRPCKERNFLDFLGIVAIYTTLGNWVLLGGLRK